MAYFIGECVRACAVAVAFLAALGVCAVCACWCPVLRWDVKVSSYAAGNGCRGGRAYACVCLLYLGGRVVAVGTEVPTTCF